MLRIQNSQTIRSVIYALYKGRFLYLQMKEMRNRGDETSRIILANQQNGLEPPAGLRRDFEHFLFLV